MDTRAANWAEIWAICPKWPINTQNLAFWHQKWNYHQHWLNKYEYGLNLTQIYIFKSNVSFYYRSYLDHWTILTFFFLTWKGRFLFKWPEVRFLICLNLRNGDWQLEPMVMNSLFTQIWQTLLKCMNLTLISVQGSSEKLFLFLLALMEVLAFNK